MAGQEAFDAEVRRRLKNLQEGTTEWEIRYQQTVERLRTIRGD
jgi:hypothetical protein